MSRGHTALSSEQHFSASEGGEGVDPYEGETGLHSYRKGNITSDERAGAAFTTRNIAHEKVLGLSKRTRASVYEFGDSASTPTFNDANQ